MGLIKNFDQLANTELRKKALSLVEAGLQAIEPQEVLQKNITCSNDILKIHTEEFNLKNYKRIFLVGFGKGSSGISKYLEELLGDKLTKGFDIDVVDETFKKIEYTKGTHPLPSQQNILFTQMVLEELADLTDEDLVIVVICGGGSVLFEASTLTLEQLSQVNSVLLKSGATISEMNVIRKHVSKVKGGKLAKKLYPATVVSLLFSDVPGNDLSVIASGPTVPDTSTDVDVKAILDKYHMTEAMRLSPNLFSPTASDERIFKNVHNILVVSNKTSLDAMQKKAEELDLTVKVLTDRLQGDAKELGKYLIDQAKSGQVLLAGGESTVHVTGKGKGGRNQALVLASLPFVVDGTIIIAFDSDGWDFYGFAGAVGDTETIAKGQKLGLDQKAFLDDDDSYAFFEKTGDGIDTGKLESNVSDLFLVIKE